MARFQSGTPVAETDSVHVFHIQEGTPAYEKIMSFLAPQVLSIFSHMSDAAFIT